MMRYKAITSRSPNQTQGLPSPRLRAFPNLDSEPSLILTRPSLILTRPSLIHQVEACRGLEAMTPSLLNPHLNTPLLLPPSYPLLPPRPLPHHHAQLHHRPPLLRSSVAVRGRKESEGREPWQRQGMRWEGGEGR